MPSSPPSSTGLAPRVDDLATTDGPGAPAGRAARRLHHPRDGRSAWSWPIGSIEGTATDITDDGHLIVVTANGPETVVTGDVVHLRGTGPPGLGGGARG